jgi:hypothetical protein
VTSGLYQHARAALAAEVAAQRQFWLLATPSTLRSFQQASATMTEALENLARTGIRRDRLLASRVGVLQRTYARRSEQFYRVLSGGDDTAAAELDLRSIEPVRQTMARDVDAATTLEDR